MGTALRKAHNSFYHKFVKVKREDLVRKVDQYVNGGKDESEQERARAHMRDAASNNYLTPFETQGFSKKSKKPKQDEILHVTDYTSMIDPILQKRESH
jgi:hypothetical protein